MSSDYFASRKQSTLSDGFDISAASPLSPTTPSTPLVTRSNALSSKVSSVLSTSFADLDIKNALFLLDQQQICNTAETRRQLRLDVQKEVIESNGEVIRQFGQVADRLKRIGAIIASLSHSCEDMRRHVTAAHQETAPVLEEASELMVQRDHVRGKEQLLMAFNSHFIMNDAEVAILTSTAEPVDDKFFTVLARAKKIQKDCEVLLGTENQRLGLELVEQISRNLNNAFQKLYRWVQREFKALNLENPQLGSSIRRALRVLAERPSLFQNCLDFLAEAREHVLSDAFYTALTGTSSTGEEDHSVKPMELLAHDPLRYVGDMLAWMHSATVSEREALEALFISDGDEIAKGIQAGRNSEPWTQFANAEDNVTFDGVKALNELVDRDILGVARVLRQRIEQVIRSHEETTLAYKIANLLNFYQATFSKLLGTDLTLLETFAGLEDSAMRQFRALMRDNIATLQAEPQSVSADLSSPEFFQDGLKQLSALLNTYNSSFTPASSQETEFQPVLAEAFDPYMKGCETLASDLDTPDKNIFALNCLFAAKNTLSPFTFTSNSLRAVEEKIEEHSRQLTIYQYLFFRHTSGLHPLLEATLSFKEPPSLADLQSHAQFKPERLVEASQTLDDFLPSALMDAMENLKELRNGALSRQITEQAVDQFCDEFEALEEKLLAADDPEDQDTDEDDNAQHNLRAYFPRTSAELRVLLS